jgi:hypothetical protein
MIPTKKLISITAAVMLCAGLASCGGSSDESSSSSLKSLEDTAKTAVTIDSEEASQAEESDSSDSVESDTDSTDSSSADVSQSSSSGTIQISADWTDLEFVFDNQKIAINESTLGDLLEGDWKADANSEWLADSLDEQIRGTSFSDFTVCKEDYPEYSDDGMYTSYTSVSVDIATFGYTELTLRETYIIGFKADIGGAVNNSAAYPNIALQGNISFGSSRDDIIAAFGEPLSEEDAEVEAQLWVEGSDNTVYDSKVMKYENGTKFMELTVDDKRGLTAVYIYDTSYQTDSTDTAVE